MQKENPDQIYQWLGNGFLNFIANISKPVTEEIVCATIKIIT